MYNIEDDGFEERVVVVPVGCPLVKIRLCHVGALGVAARRVVGAARRVGRAVAAGELDQALRDAQLVETRRRLVLVPDFVRVFFVKEDAAGLVLNARVDVLKLGLEVHDRRKVDLGAERAVVEAVFRVLVRRAGIVGGRVRAGLAVVVGHERERIVEARKVGLRRRAHLLPVGGLVRVVATTFVPVHTTRR